MNRSRATSGAPHQLKLQSRFGQIRLRSLLYFRERSGLRNLHRDARTGQPHRRTLQYFPGSGNVLLDRRDQRFLMRLFADRQLPKRLLLILLQDLLILCRCHFRKRWSRRSRSTFLLPGKY